MSRLEIILGPMMASKSTELITRLSRYLAVGLKVLYVNNALDTRSIDNISTHNPTLSVSSAITSMKVPELPYAEEVSSYDVIGIDEAQFFDDLVPRVKEWLVSGKHVIVAGLDGTATQVPFGHTLELIPLCDNVIKLCALCKFCCSEGHGKVPAPFTKKTVLNGTMTVDVGGSDKYVAVCRKHLL